MQFLALLLLIATSICKTTPLHAQGDPARAFNPATAAIRKPGTILRIELIGDSTQTDHAGYGRGFCANLTAQVDCDNMAKGGASTRTFREQGQWKRSLATKPDYMLIQFGHNDMERLPYYPPETTMAEYEANLRRYVTEARAAGIQPILVTPITRQYFGADGKIDPPLIHHSETMKRVAREMHVPLIDLHDQSVAILDRMGPEKGGALAISTKDRNGKTVPDKTHWNWEGSYFFGRLVAVDMGKAVPALAKYVRPEAAPLPPEGIREMKFFHGGPVKIVLVGDETVTADEGWGKAFCATLTSNVTCVDLAAAGASSKSYIEDGLWKKALAEKADYYILQFGKNDMYGDAAQKTDAGAGYDANLRRYIEKARVAGAIPILVTPVADTLESSRGLRDYADSAVQVAAEEDASVVDLNEATRGLFSEDASQYKLEKDEARIVANTMIKTRTELGPDVIGVPKASMPQVK